MLLNIIKKYFCYIFLIIMGIFIISCTEDLNGQVCVKNYGGYDIINLRVGDTEYGTVKTGDTTSYKSFSPGSYKIKGVIDLDDHDNIKFEKTFQVNVSRTYNIKIRNEKDEAAYIDIKEE